MPQINISLDEKNENYILTGDINNILLNRRAWSNFSNTLKAENDSQNSRIIIPNDESSESTYKNIIKLFSKFEIAHENAEEVSNQHNRYLKELENFATFSVKAKNIRNNKSHDNDFKHFAEIIQNKLIRKLYPHQLLSAYHLAFSQHACNFSVPGAGKTSVVLAAFAYLNSLPTDNPKHVDKLLIVGPLSSFKAWEDEYRSCFGQDCDSYRLSGGGNVTDKKNYFYQQKQSLITLIHYQSLTSQKENIKRFLDTNKVMVVLDEAHRIKNLDGRWSSAALELAKTTHNCSRVILTGTPIPNGYQDLYSLYKFIWPDKEVLDISYMRLSQLTENSFKPSAREQIDQIIDNASPFFIRIKKSDLNLPAPINHSPILIEMNPIQQKIYSAIESKFMPNILEDEKKKDAIGILRSARYMRLMQCATNPSMLLKPILVQDDEEIFSEVSDDLDLSNDEIYDLIRNYENSEVPCKFEGVLELVKSILNKSGPDGKVIIWTIFLDTMDKLKEALQKIGIKSEMLRGSTPTEADINAVIRGELTREKIIDQFHEDNCEFKVIIANPFAVGESISLHKACHNAIYLERNFNAAQFMQSKDRIHRVGLKETDQINYYYVLAQDSIDQAIHDRLLIKEARMLEVIESEEIPLISENIDFNSSYEDNDIKAIIRDYVSRKG